VVDASYGRGHFWKLLRKSDYKLTKQDFLWRHDAAKTGLKANGFDAFVFDPPFIRNAGSTYRLTHTREFLRETGAQPGDQFLLTRESDGTYSISLRKADHASSAVIRLRGWREIH
jgi:hypothetical protein